MSLMDKIKSLFSGGSDGHSHADHDHAGHDHSHEPVAPPMPPADPAGMPTADAPADESGDRIE
jgi:hypothetical protein